MRELAPAELAAYNTQGVTHEQVTRLAFSTLLDTLPKTVGWTLVLEQTLTNRKRPKGTLVDSFKIPRGYWKAKEIQDDLDAEIQTKIRRGYPLTNTIFEDTRRAVLISPHSASTSDREHARLSELFCANLRRYLASEPLQNRLDAARLY